ncbi:MAG: LysM peptidoglycan-binding domain-containing protein [Propionibacteriaceae bacterium]|nr:LysM peptidoglycan-binding domain-containing protein [Propionibacteriaceae bacterium]
MVNGVRRVLAGLVLLVLVVGVPVLLVGAGRWDAIARVIENPAVLTAPDDGSIILGVLTLLGAVLWCVLVVAIVLEFREAQAEQVGGDFGMRWGSRGNVSREIEPTHGALSLPRAIVRPLIVAALGIGPMVSGAAPALADQLGAPPPVVSTLTSAEAYRWHSGEQSSDEDMATLGQRAESASRSSSTGWADDRGGDHSFIPIDDLRDFDETVGVITHVVQPGDSLWSITERYLGDGAEWQHVAQANANLLATSDVLEVGWTLVIPQTTPDSDGAAAEETTESDVRDSQTGWEREDTNAPTGGGGANSSDAGAMGPFVPSGNEETPEAEGSAPEVARHIVESGETLWSIAGEELGDHDRWPELYAANEEQVTDPNVIIAGSQLIVPIVEKNEAATEPYPDDRLGSVRGGADASGDARDTTSETDRDLDGDTSREGDPGSPINDDAADQGTTSNAGAISTRVEVGPVPPGENSHQADTSALDAQETEDDLTPLVTAGGIGFLLAGGLTLLLRRRREDHLSTRPLMRRIPTTSPGARRWESALGVTAASDRASDPVEAVADAIEVHDLTEGAGTGRLIFFDENGVEVTDRWGHPLPASHANTGAESQPWALVGLGRDEAGRIVMADIEQPAPVRIEAAQASTALASAMGVAVELACQRWSEGVEVVVVGRMNTGDDGDADKPSHDAAPHSAEMAVFDSFPLVTVIDEIEEGITGFAAAIDERRSHLGGHDLAHWRADPDVRSAWCPVVYIFLTSLTAEQTARITKAGAGPVVGVTAVTTVVSGEPGGVTTTEIDDRPIERLAPSSEEESDLSQTREMSFDPTWLEEGPGEPLVVRVSAEGRSTLVPLGVAVQPPLLRPDDDLIELLETTANEETTTAWWSCESGQCADGESDAMSDMAAIAGSVGDHPALLLLGPVELQGARGEPPARAARSCLEYLAWLIEHPGATAREMAQGLLVAEGTRRSNMSRLRTWLGRAEDGRPYLPDAYSGRITVDGAVTTDWHLLRRLIIGGVEQASTERLAAALSLVRGAPLADAAPGQWHWAEEMRTDMISVIRDIAVVLGDRHIDAQRLEEARAALDIALRVAPDDELLLATRIRLEDATGNRGEVDRLANAIIANARGRGLDLADSTVALLQEVMEGAVRQARVPAAPAMADKPASPFVPYLPRAVTASSSSPNFSSYRPSAGMALGDEPRDPAISQVPRRALL